MLSFILFYIIACLVPTFIFGKFVMNMFNSLEIKNDIISVLLTLNFILFILLDIYAVKEYVWYKQAFKPAPAVFQVYVNPFALPEESQ